MSLPPEAVWALSALLLAAGVAGTVLPMLPGAPLILAAAVLHKAFLPAYLSWWTVGVVAAVAVSTFFLEAAAAAAGGRRFGAGPWGLAGAAAGAFAGLFFGPLGLLLGAVGGAAAAELALAKRPLADALRAGFGAALGLLVSAAARVALAGLMTVLLLADCFLI